MTKEIYQKFVCGSLLPFFQNYSKQRKILDKEEEARQRLKAAEKLRKEREKLQKEKEKALLAKRNYPNKNFSKTNNFPKTANYSKAANSYAKKSTFNYSSGSMSRENYQANKKRAFKPNGYAARSKKSKYSNEGSNETSTNAGTSSGYSNSPYKKKFFKKKWPKKY